MKTRIPAVITAFAIAAFFSGCASTYRVALTSEAASQLTAANTSGLIAIEKDEIGTSIKPSNAGASLGMFGLVGGLAAAITDSAVNSKSSKKAEAGVVDIRNGLLDYSFERALTNAFEQTFSRTGGHVAMSAVLVSKNTASSEIARLAREAKGDAVAIVFVRHLMSPDFNDVVLVTEAVICPKTEALRKNATTKTYASQEVPVLYRNKIQTFWPIPVADKPAKPTMQTVAAAWAKENAGRVREALDAASTEIAKIIQWDIGLTATGGGGETGEARQTFDYSNNSAMATNGAVCRHENKRVWLRASNGCLYVQPE